MYDDDRFIIPCIKRSFLLKLVEAILDEESNPYKVGSRAYYIYLWAEYEVYYLTRHAPLHLLPSAKKITDVMELTTKHTVIDKLVEFGKLIEGMNYKEIKR